MTPQQYERLTELFHAALEIAPDQRTLFLDQLSDGDAYLRRELESLLAVRAQRPADTEPPEDIAAAYLVHQSGTPGALPSLTPNTRIDRYEIRSLLGKGGMGEVYLAEDLRLHRKVALKILPAAVAANQDRMRRFEQEAAAAAALNHPHIAHIYEIGESESTHFIAMEYLDGDTLRDRIHRDHAPLGKLLKYLTQVAEGLAKAHAAGIVHRDLKPDNIMITRDDYAKILDFGLAKLIERDKPADSDNTASSEAGMALRNHSLSGMVMGTAGYMSPEQAQGKVDQIDHRSDIFSFGCILFEAVTGQKPFADESVIKSLHKVVYESAPQIKDVSPSAPPDLQRIVRRCLAKDPDERYQTIKDVALELKEVRQGIAGATKLDTTTATSIGTRTWGRPASEPSPPSTSSAEYIATEIKRHKKGVAIFFAALAVVFAYGLYRLVSPKRSVVSAPAIKIIRLTATGKVWSGLISPDGKQVVYTVDDAGQESIWLRQVATASNLPIVPPSEASYTAFSFTHDGNYLYFIKREKNGPDSLYQMAALGGVARKIVANVSSRAALSADDQLIAFIRGGPFADENSLIVANRDGTGERVIATHKSPDNFYSGGVAWTPDGKSITCIAGNNGRKLIEVPLDGGADKLLATPKWISILNIEWLPDPSGLIVIAKEQMLSSPAQIWYLSYPSGEARKLTNGFEDYANLSLSSDAKSLVVTRQETTAHIWVAPDGDATRAKQITTGTGRQDGYPSVSWTPDGRITYISTASGSRHIWIMNADGSDQRQLADGANDDQGGGRVSPDGRYVVFISNRTGIFHVYRMDIDGNNLKQLTDGTGEVAPIFSTDGRWVIYSSGLSGPGLSGPGLGGVPPNLSSWKVPIDGGERMPLTNDCMAQSSSPDGKLVACVRRIGSGALLLWNISIVPFAGGPPVQTFNVTSESRPNSRWTPDGRSIIYNLTEGGVLSRVATRGSSLAEGGNLTGVTNLWIQSLAGGPPKQLTNFAAESFFSFDWSRDGKQLVYGRGATTSDAVLISDFR